MVAYSPLRVRASIKASSPAFNTHQPRFGLNEDDVILSDDEEDDQGVATIPPDSAPSSSILKVRPPIIDIDSEPELETLSAPDEAAVVDAARPSDDDDDDSMFAIFDDLNDEPRRPSPLLPSSSSLLAHQQSEPEPTDASSEKGEAAHAGVALAIADANESEADSDDSVEIVNEPTRPSRCLRALFPDSDDEISDEPIPRSNVRRMLDTVEFSKMSRLSRGRTLIDPYSSDDDHDDMPLRFRLNSARFNEGNVTRHKRVRTRGRLIESDEDDEILVPNPTATAAKADSSGHDDNDVEEEEVEFAVGEEVNEHHNREHSDSPAASDDMHNSVYSVIADSLFESMHGDATDESKDGDEHEIEVAFEDLVDEEVVIAPSEAHKEHLIGDELLSELRDVPEDIQQVANSDDAIERQSESGHAAVSVCNEFQVSAQSQDTVTHMNANISLMKAVRESLYVFAVVGFMAPFNGIFAGTQCCRNTNKTIKSARRRVTYPDLPVRSSKRMHRIAKSSKLARPTLKTLTVTIRTVPTVPPRATILSRIQQVRISSYRK